MNLFVKSALHFGLIFASAPAFAEMPVVYECWSVASAIGIPEERNIFVLSGPGNGGGYQAKADAIDFVNDTTRPLWSAEVFETRSAVELSFAGRTSQGEFVSISVLENPRSGSIGLFAPTYTAIVEVGNSARSEWTCTSPLDPQ